MAAKKRKKAAVNARKRAEAARKERAQGTTGRPSKFSPFVVDRVLQALSTGATREAAAAHAGIATRTLYDWIDLGKAALEAGEDGCRPVLNLEEVEADSDVDPVLAPVTTHAQFVQAIRDAEMMVQVQCLSLIQQAAAHTWQAAAWIVERKFRDAFGKQTAVTVGGSTSPGAVPVAIDADVKVTGGVIILPALTED